MAGKDSNQAAAEEVSSDKSQLSQQDFVDLDSMTPEQAMNLAAYWYQYFKSWHFNLKMICS